MTKLILLAGSIVVVAVTGVGFALPATSGTSARTVVRAEFSTADDLTFWQTWSTARGEGMTVSISDQGNISRFESPWGYRHSFVSNEGYYVCYTNPETGEYVVGQDLGPLTDGVDWGPPTTTTSPVTVTRTTTDGAITYKQQFVFDGSADRFTITNQITNNLGATIPDVIFRRLIRFQVDEQGSEGWGFNNDWAFHDSKDGAVGWDDPARAAAAGKLAHQLILGHQVGPSTRFAKIHGFSPGLFVCDPPDKSGADAGPLPPGEHYGTLQYNIGAVAPGVTKTVRIQYTQD